MVENMFTLTCEVSPEIAYHTRTPHEAQSHNYRWKFATKGFHSERTRTEPNPAIANHESSQLLIARRCLLRSDNDVSKM